MINKVNKETYSKVVRELLWQRMESAFWKGEYERQYGNTLGLAITCILETLVFGFILFTS